jgi:hypothetical protein
MATFSLAFYPRNVSKDIAQFPATDQFEPFIEIVYDKAGSGSST